MIIGELPWPWHLCKNYTDTPNHELGCQGGEQVNSNILSYGYNYPQTKTVMTKKTVTTREFDKDENLVKEVTEVTETTEIVPNNTWTYNPPVTYQSYWDNPLKTTLT